jgi:hypothetical protein
MQGQPGPWSPGDISGLLEVKEKKELTQIKKK